MSSLSQLSFVDNDQAGAICPLCKGRGQRTKVNEETGFVGPHKCECQQPDEITNGVQWMPEIGEYGIFIGGVLHDFVLASAGRAKAEEIYHERLRVFADHRRRNPANSDDPIPFDGRPGEYNETGTPADYGLERW